MFSKKSLLWVIILLAVVTAGGVFWYVNQQQAAPYGELPQETVTIPLPPADNVVQIENETKALEIESPDADLDAIEKELGL
mgnify:CR=1 FL=1